MTCHRPSRLVVVLGTATGVGKTWTVAALLRSLRDGGAVVAARKPVQSFGPEDAAATDAHVLAEAAAGEAPEDICPAHRWYEAALAPPMAAEVLERGPFTVADLVGELAWPTGTEIGMVEAVGGPRSPMAADGDCLDLAAALAPDAVLLVADAGLGAINAVRLSATAAAAAVGSPVIVFLNRFDDEDPDRRNLAWLRAEGYDVVTTVGDAADRLAALISSRTH